MPAQHAGVRVVLVLAIDLLDVGRRGSAEGDNDVDVLQDHTGAVELKLDVDVDDAPCAVVLRPAVDGERSSVLSGVGPAKDTDAMTEGNHVNQKQDTRTGPYTYYLFSAAGRAEIGPSVRKCYVPGPIDIGP